MGVLRAPRLPCRAGHKMSRGKKKTQKARNLSFKGTFVIRPLPRIFFLFQPSILLFPPVTDFEIVFWRMSMLAVAGRFGIVRAATCAAASTLAARRVAAPFQRASFRTSAPSSLKLPEAQVEVSLFRWSHSWVTTAYLVADRRCVCVA